ncbi:hypothetical protein BASA81_005860 [Batrachochytrium salamandrivorans]|nr:hypothetical protein BASA81_005860 [Batrachochytrium salamandrivorans]
MIFRNVPADCACRFALLQVGHCRFGYCRLTICTPNSVTTTLNMSVSLRLFRSHLQYRADGTVDASQIHSRQCYLGWLRIGRKADSENECKKFQRSLSNHTSGVDGRTPFEPEEEAAILLVLRQKRNWPCFHPSMRIGSLGYRSYGYHEKIRLQQQRQQPTATVNLDLESFSRHIDQYSNALARFGIDVSASIYGLFSLFCEAKWLAVDPTRQRLDAAPKARYAQELCRTLTWEHGEKCVVTVSSLGDFSKRILAQNSQSKLLLGDCVQTQGHPVPSKYWGVLVYAMGLAYSSPGTFVPIQIGDASTFAAKHFYVDPISNLCCTILTPKEYVL